MEIIETRTATIQMIGANILLCTMKKNAGVDVADVIENYEISKRLTMGERYASLVDARQHAALSNKAKKNATNPEMYTEVIAQAVVITSLTTRLLINFMLRFNTQIKNVEIKMFNDYDDSLAWLKKKLFEEQVALGIEKYRARMRS